MRFRDFDSIERPPRGRSGVFIFLLLLLPLLFGGCILLLHVDLYDVAKHVSASPMLMLVCYALGMVISWCGVKILTAEQEILTREAQVSEKLILHRSLNDLSSSAQILHQLSNQERLDQVNFNSYQVPTEYKDPVTLEIMTDPFLIDDGHHYDRTTLIDLFQHSEDWPLSPLPPRQPILRVIRDHDHRSAISQFVEDAEATHQNLQPS